MKIYHNPRCRKSRETLELLKENNVEFEVVEYLKEVPDRDEMKLILQKLNISPKELVRKNEAVYKEKFKNASFTDDEWIDILIEYPKLIERPIVVKDYKAIIGRPPSLVLDLLK